MNGIAEYVPHGMSIVFSRLLTFVSPLQASGNTGCIPIGEDSSNSEAGAVVN